MFIDGGYLAAVLKDEYGQVRIAFDKLSDIIVGSDYERLRTYFY